MASLESEGPTTPVQPPPPPTPTAGEPATPPTTTDPYEAAVEHLLDLLEENQVALTALAQAWRHTNRSLRLTQAQLAHTEQMLAWERGLGRPAADDEVA